ncbi:MAG: lipid II flippase MurJ [Actinomycetaceae bacterium]|nr:lipid II flippase MurJ [Actinomycetaceae bacterium]
MTKDPAKPKKEDPTPASIDERDALLAKPSGLARSSAIMFAGTLTSRALGFLRSALLLAAIGGFGASDAFNAANTLPNTIYNLLAGGVLSAILVPQIVRSLRGRKAGDREGEDAVNALLTLAAIILLAITVLSVLGASILITLYNAGLDPEFHRLAVIFAIWCLPQIFFYGTYALLGQVLNAHSVFGPYMWAPVLNNVIAIAGIGIYVGLFGFTGPATIDTALWTFDRVAILAGSATLGVVMQALVLLIPLKRLGFHLRINTKFKGHGLKRAGKVAGWAFAALLVGQLGYLAVTNTAAAANGWGVANDQFVPATTIYATAYMIYMLPQSLITTSITTALFTGMAMKAAANDTQAVSADYSRGARIIGIFTVFSAAFFVVASVPIAQLIGPRLPVEQALGMAKVLAIMSLGIAFQGLFSLNNRVFYAFEDTRTAFFTQIPLSVITIAGALLSVYFLPADWWVGGAVGADALGTAAAALTGFYLLHQRGVTTQVFRSIAKTYGLLLIGVLPPSLAAWALLAWWGPVSHDPQWISHIGETGAHFCGALARCAAVGVLMLVVYFLTLLVLRLPELRSLKDLRRPGTTNSTQK